MSSSLLSLAWRIAIGVLFFWITSRGGCGMMRLANGHHADRANGYIGRPASGKPVDPVCGMAVDPAKAPGTRVTDGRSGDTPRERANGKMKVIGAQAAR